MLQSLFHAWERHLVSTTKDRVVRPFEWGLDWIPQNGHREGASPADVIGDWVAQVMADVPLAQEVKRRGEEQGHEDSNGFVGATVRKEDGVLGFVNDGIDRVHQHPESSTE